MGVVIWYRLEFRTGRKAPPLLRVSNDVLQGGLVLDTAVSTKATLGPHPSTFEITLWDLPLDEVKGLAEQSRARVGTKDPLLVDIALGYFDQPSTQRTSVMLGAINEIRTDVADDGTLLTQVMGMEWAGYQLRLNTFRYDKPGRSTFDEIFDKVQTDTTVPIRHIGVRGEDQDRTLEKGTALSALGELAGRAGVPLAVRAGQAVLGTAGDSVPPIKFRAEHNIVSRRRRDSGSPDPQGGPGTTTRYRLKVLGDPGLQIGAKADLEDSGSADLRVESVEHVFSLRAGYTCEVALLDVQAAKRPEAVDGVHAVADDLHSLTRSVLADHPTVDIGDVASYNKAGDGENGGHRTTFDYGRQRSASSVDDPVDNRLVLHDKPMSSVFAWDRTGLMVPVYPGMRAVLVHNGAQVNDAIGTGFLWSRHANHQPPKNEPGDYWLCLPTEVAGGRPAGKGVNDLTDASGHRVIQAAGLDIQVGTEVLPEVGERPAPPTGQTLIIKHGKGTTITVAEDGSVDITTDNKDVTFGNGAASITISGGEITLTADSIKLAASSVEVG